MRITKQPFKGVKAKHYLAQFDSVGQFMAWIDDNAPKSFQSFKGSFYSNENWSTVQTKAVEGDKDAAKRAASLMNKIKAASPATKITRKKASPVGRASVGAYLAGHPMPCKQIVTEKVNNAPIAVVVGLTSRASVSASDMEKRGVAIAAMVKKLALTRPVTLYLSGNGHCSGTDGACALIKFPTAPLDSYRLAYLLSSQGFGRGALFSFYGAVNKLGAKNSGKSPDYGISPVGSFNYAHSQVSQFATDLETHLGKDVFYIPGADDAQKDHKAMVGNPVQWLNDTCDRLTATQ